MDKLAINMETLARVSNLLIKNRAATGRVIRTTKGSLLSEVMPAVTIPAGKVPSSMRYRLNDPEKLKPLVADMARIHNIPASELPGVERYLRAVRAPANNISAQFSARGEKPAILISKGGLAGSTVAKQMLGVSGKTSPATKRALNHIAQLHEGTEATRKGHPGKYMLSLVSPATGNAGQHRSLLPPLQDLNVARSMKNPELEDIVAKMHSPVLAEGNVARIWNSGGKFNRSARKRLQEVYDREIATVAPTMIRNNLRDHRLAMN